MTSDNKKNVDERLMAYRSDKPKKKLSKAKQFQLARDQWNAYTRARDNGHQDYIAVAKRCDAF